MKPLRKPVSLALVGATTVVTSLLGFSQAFASQARSEYDDGDDACESGFNATTMVTLAKERAARASRATAAAVANEAAAARRVRQLRAHGTAKQKADAAKALEAAKRATRHARAAEKVAVAAAKAAAHAAASAPGCGATPSTPSPTPTPTTPAGPPPTVPSGGLTTPTSVQASSASDLANGAFQLTWSPVAGAAKYEIARDGVVLGNSSATNFTPPTTVANERHSYTVTAINGSVRSSTSVAISAGRYVGDSAADKRGLTTYGQIQVSLVVTANRVTGCWATYPTSGDSASINAIAIPTLCAEAISAQSSTIAAVSGASATSPAFRTSLQSALTRAGI